MKVTATQANVLRNLYRINFTQVSRTRRAMLDGKDCRLQLISLGAMKLIRWDGQSHPTKIAEPEGIKGHAGRVRYPASVTAPSSERRNARRAQMQVQPER